MIHFPVVSDAFQVRILRLLGCKLASGNRVRLDMLAACTNSLSGDGKSFADMVLAACVCANAQPGPVSAKSAMVTTEIAIDQAPNLKAGT